MKIYIKSADKNKKLKIGYRELAEKMWFKEINGNELEISHVGNDDDLQCDFYISLRLDKWLNDKRWSEVNHDLNYEDIDMDRAKFSSSSLIEIMSKHVEILTIDKRAMFIMVYEVANEINGEISESNMENWIAAEEFKSNHQELFDMTYDEANEISLEEVKSNKIKVEEEPWELNEEEFTPQKSVENSSVKTNEIKTPNKRRTYENIIRGIEAHMISLCLDYSDYEADSIYVNCSVRKFMDSDIFSNDHFYVVDNEVVRRNELSEYVPSVLDSYKAQKEIDDFLKDDFMEIVKLYAKANREMPTEIRITYNTNIDKLSIENSYEELIAEKNDEPDYVVERWVEEIQDSLE